MSKCLHVRHILLLEFVWKEVSFYNVLICVNRLELNVMTYESCTVVYCLQIPFTNVLLFNYKICSTKSKRTQHTTIFN